MPRQVSRPFPPAFRPLGSSFPPRFGAGFRPSNLDFSEEMSDDGRFFRSL